MTTFQQGSTPQQQLAQAQLSGLGQQPGLGHLGQFGLAGYSSPVSGLVNGLIVIPHTEQQQPALAVIGAYELRREHNGYCLRVQSRPICFWYEQPDRALLAAMIWSDRGRRPKVNARDEFGTLIGVRWYSLTSDYHLQSPQQATVWETNVLTAISWDESSAVRGTCGIHAAWPARNGKILPRVDAIGEGRVLAKVRGFGRVVIGTEGWRAEKVICDTVYLPADLFARWRVRKRFASLYPAVTFEEEPWTLERSSK